MARRYAVEHGTLAAPKDAVIEGYPVGRWLEKRRAQGKTGILAAGRDVALDALVDGEAWNPAHWTPDWQRHLTYARQLLDARGDGARLDDVALDVVHRGTPIGRGVARQRSGWDRLGEEQRTALTALGLTPPAPAPAAVVGEAGPAGGSVVEPNGPGPSAPVSRRSRSR